MSQLENSSEMNIIDYKSKIETMMNGLFNEYLSLESRHLQEKENNTNLLKDSNSKQKSMNDLLQEKSDIIEGLEQEVLNYQSRESELQNTVTNLKEQLESKVVPETTENKFDMLRSQAKEISAKDKEIVRLTNELVKLKEKLELMDSEKMNNVQMVLKDKKQSVVGWSPTSCPSPNPVTEVPPIELSDSCTEVEPTSNDEVNDEVDEATVDGATVEEEDEEEYEPIKYKKQGYFCDSKNNIYEMLENDEVGDCIGFRVKDGVYKKSGKDKYKYTFN